MENQRKREPIPFDAKKTTWSKKVAGKSNQTAAPNTSTINKNGREEDQPYVFCGKTSDFFGEIKTLEG